MTHGAKKKSLFHIISARGGANPIVSGPSAPRHNTISDYKTCVKVTVVYRASRANVEAVVVR